MTSTAGTIYHQPLHSVQALRAIAAWMIVFTHYVGVFYNYGVTSHLATALTRFGDFGVDIFFVISGFVMYYSSSDRPVQGHVFAIRRLARIAPAYWAYTFLLILVWHIYPTFSWTAYTPMSLALSLTFIPHENPAGLGRYPFLSVGWTLCYEMIFYAIISAAMLILRKRAYLLVLTVLSLLPVTHFDWISNWRLYEFAAGILIAMVYKSYNFGAGNVSRAIGCFCISVCALLLLWKLNGTAIARIGSSSLIVSCFIVSESLYRPCRLVNVFDLLGNISYSTYLSHIFVLGIAYFYIGVPKSQPHALAGLAVLCVVIFLYRGVVTCSSSALPTD